MVVSWIDVKYCSPPRKHCQNVNIEISDPADLESDWQAVLPTQPLHQVTTDNHTVPTLSAV